MILEAPGEEPPNVPARRPRRHPTRPRQSERAGASPPARPGGTSRTVFQIVPLRNCWRKFPTTKLRLLIVVAARRR